MRTTKQAPIDRPFHDLIAIGAALRNPNIDNNQYQKLFAKYGERVPTGRGFTFTGGRMALTQYYGKRNEDAQLIFNPQIQDYI
jgi:hypothetical protein